MDRKLKEMNIVPFEVKHFSQIEMRDKDIFFAPDNLREILSVLQKDGNCYSAFYRNELIFLGGIKILREGVGEAWVLCSKKIYRFARELYYHSEGFLKVMAKNYNLVRIQAHIDSKWKEACNFIENLGFYREGLLKKCFYERDYFIYGRLF